MRLMKLFDNKTVRGYCVITAAVVSMCASVFVFDIFPTLVRQIAATALIAANLMSLFVVYAPMVEGHLTGLRRARHRLSWPSNHTSSLLVARENLFWTYFEHQPEVQEWLADNTSGRSGIMPINSSNRERIGTTLWFEDANDVVAFRMRWL